jgi:transcriptional regulator with XRE-family HTH domain
MNLVELGQKIRALRIERDMTLDDVVARSGLTRSWLSKVENFRVTPSLPALMEIARALRVPVTRLLEDLDRRPDFVLVKQGDGPRITRDREVSNIVYESLAHERPDRAMDPFVLTIPPGGGRSKALSHEGEEFLRVLSGRVEFHYGDGMHELEAGDSLYFNASTPHRLTNRWAKPASILCVFHGEQAPSSKGKRRRGARGRAGTSTATSGGVS